MSKSTWVRTKPLFTKEQIKKITKKATIRQKLRLLFRPSQYAVDGKYIIRYKKMDGIIFVMNRGTHEI